MNFPYPADIPVEFAHTVGGGRRLVVRSVAEVLIIVATRHRKARRNLQERPEIHLRCHASSVHSADSDVPVHLDGLHIHIHARHVARPLLSTSPLKPPCASSGPPAASSAPC